MRFIYLLIILSGCTTSDQSGIEIIDSIKLRQLQEDGVQVVDIRTKKEFDNGHIPGVMHIDFMSSDFMNRMNEFSVSEPIIIHCASGGRSKKASDMLQKAGFELIYDYSGGFADWKSKGLKIE